MGVQFITDSSGARLVVLPEAEYLTLVDDRDTLADIEAIERFRRRLAAGDEELVPAEIVDRLLDGENKIRVWREYRGMSAKDLATKAGIAAPYLSQIETGARDGGIDTLKKIAEALNLTLDDIA